MAATGQQEVNGQQANNTTPAFEQLLAALHTCSRDEKRALLDRVLRDLIGDKPEREYGLYNPDGSSYLFLVPERIYEKYQETPEFLAEMERRRLNPGKIIPNSEVLARINALQTAADAGASQSELISMLIRLKPDSEIVPELVAMKAAEDAKQAREKGT